MKKTKIIGILPMAGKATRLQPIGFSKELYPVVFKGKHFAISEFNIRSMLMAGADEIRLVVNPDKMDIARYYARYSSLTPVYFYESPSLPESCLYTIDSLHDDDVCIFGLPDTLFAPIVSHAKLVKTILSEESDICLGLFNVTDASKYDSVKLDKNNNVKAVLVKQTPPLSQYIWGIWAARVWVLKILKKIIEKQNVEGTEKLLGLGFDILAKNKKIRFKGVKLSNKYFDIGTMDAVLRANEIINDFKIS